MNSRKKIINELRFQLDSKEVKDQHYSVQLSASDANAILSLLQEQNPVDPFFERDVDGVFVWSCGACGAYLYHIYGGLDRAKAYVKYCSKCGRPVKWDDTQ